MIERKILYYPTILVPSKWLKWAVFYWDKASSIVPAGWEDNPVLTHPLHKKNYEVMNYLWKEAGLFDPTRPNFPSSDRTRGRVGRAYSKISEELWPLLDSTMFRRQVNKKWTSNPTCRIHADKFTNPILDTLDDLGLVKADEYDKRWYFAEENTFLIYMALLARNLADVDIDYTVPSTDWNEYEKILFESDDKNNGFPSLKVKFLDVLPIPRDDVDIKEIIKFKRKRENELLGFREVIDEFQRGISHVENEAEIKKILLQYKEKIQKERENLSKSMKNSRIKAAFATIRSLVSLKSPALVETIGFSLAKMPSTISVSIIVGTASVQIGYAWIDNRNKQTAKIRESAFSYLYHAKKEKII